MLGLVIAFGLGAAVSHAADQVDFTEPRGFIGGGFGGAFNTGDFDDAGNSLGTEIRGGYRFHPHVAVEGQLSYFNNVGGSFPLGDVHLRTLSFTANVKKFFPIGSGRWQPYLLAGIGVTRARAEVDNLFGNTILDRTESAFTFRGGAGLEFYITRHVNLYTEATYMLLTGGLHGAGFVPLVFGAQYQL